MYNSRIITVLNVDNVKISKRLYFMLYFIKEIFFRFISLSKSLLDGKKEWDLNDPKQLELYKLYRPERITPSKRGIDLLKSPGLNKVIFFLKIKFLN